MLRSFQKMRERLIAKGWSEDEINHLKKHFNPEKESHLIVGSIIVMLIIASIAIPYGYVLLGTMLAESLSEVSVSSFNALFHIVLVVIGLPLGSAFGIFLVDLDRLEKMHHVILLLSVPLFIAGVSFFISRLISEAGIQNAIIGAVLYAVSFITPYAYIVRREWNSRVGSVTL